MGETPTNQWTLDGARALLGEVRTRTARAVEEVDALLLEREEHPEGSPDHALAEEKIEAAMGRWARAMEALGLQVKGVWLVDFDNGSGYYCWKWPETELVYFHGYDEGFASRIRIQ
jgi:hypothetical protein